VQRGETVEFVVYWEATVPDGKDYVSFAKLLGREHRLVGQINRHPACGMTPTSLWKPGQVWRDPYRIPVAPDAVAPSRLWIEVGLYDTKTHETLGTVRVGETKLAPPETAPQAADLLPVDLADGASLVGYDLPSPDISPGETLTLTLYWQVREAPSVDYQVFVHLVGDRPEPAAQGDGPPLMGDYPTTMWAAGEVVIDPHLVALPADLSLGKYRLVVGMYNLQTMARLPRLDNTGDSIEIPTVVKVR
jgi:hypothetical protein